MSAARVRIGVRWPSFSPNPMSSRSRRFVAARGFSDRRDSALADARRATSLGKLVTGLVADLESGRPPPFTKSSAGAGQFEAEIRARQVSGARRCSSSRERRGVLAVHSHRFPLQCPIGGVLGMRDGTYMTMLSGGSPDARGEVHLRALGSTKTIAFSRGGAQTVAATRVTIPSAVPLQNLRTIPEGSCSLAS